MSDDTQVWAAWSQKNTHKALSFETRAKNSHL